MHVYTFHWKDRESLRMGLRVSGAFQAQWAASQVCEERCGTSHTVQMTCWLVMQGHAAALVCFLQQWGPCSTEIRNNVQQHVPAAMCWNRDCQGDRSGD